MPPRSKILAVDDNARNLDVLRILLGQDYVLATATSGGQALAIAPTFQPDLVLLDIMMPGIDGYETCRRLRSDPRLPWVKILMVSAKAMVSERLQGYEAGADDYITKPFDEDELLAKVRVHLRLRSVEEVDALKTSVLSLLSHETRTPLTGIIGSAELLSSDEPLALDARKDLARMLLDSAARLHTLVEKVLMLAELKAGALRFAPTMGDISGMVREALAGVAPQVTAKGVTIQCAPVETAAVLVDHGHVVRALAAILENAVRVSPSGTAVEVGVFRDQDRVRVQVTDHGPGIPPALLPRIFDEFASADFGHVDGQGLSLAIARRVIQAHDGEIEVASQHGGGATFTLALPLARDRRAGTTAQEMLR